MTINKPDDSKSRKGLEVAVIGMSGRFPGAQNIHEFWKNLKNGVESIMFFSDDEVEKAGVSSKLIEDPHYVKAFGVLENVEYFDAYFFGYTPGDAEIMNPEIRIFHECSWEALEDAGYNPESYDGSIGVFAGASSNFIWEGMTLLSGKAKEIGNFAAGHLTGADFLTTKISYKFNLRGPSSLIQTACSTSLVAIHWACRSVLSGECHIALAGGIKLDVNQKQGYMYKEGMIQSPDGHCRAFDAEAKGTVGGNGVGIVVLKRLKNAIADRDHIYAIVKGSAVNNDGNRKVGYTAPSVQGQAEVIRTAQAMAHIEPESIGYIETHGTGTQLGDPVEIEALTLAFNSDKRNYCPIGSVKTNIGHLDIAAGVAGFIKTVLILKNRIIPPSLHFKEPNPKIDFKNSPFYVNTSLRIWKNDKYPLRAGVSSFGIGGTNAHVILEEAPEIENFDDGRTWKLIMLSAKTGPTLEKLTKNFLEYVKLNPGINLADAAFTLQVGRKPLGYRRMSVCSGIAETLHAMQDTSSLAGNAVDDDKKRIIFMFDGLGGQYIDMGKDLYRSETCFREAMDQCFKIFASLTGKNLKEILYPSHATGTVSPADTEKIDRIEISQPVMFIFEYALSVMLMKWGITPDAMIGYSFGEYTAACLSGVFSLEDALKIILIRGRLLAEVPGGVMLSVPLPGEQIAPLLPGELSIAIDNGSSCIVAGPAAEVASFEQEIKQKRLLCMPVPNSVAMHSKMMEPILSKFKKELEKITFNSPKTPYISNVTGTWITPQDTGNPEYFCHHLRKTVRFADGFKKLVKKRHSIFIEVGAGRDLSTMMKRFIDDKLMQYTVNLVRPPQKNVSDVYYLLNKIGYLWLYGVNINWLAFYSGEKRYRLPLPTYPFEKKRYWFEDGFLKCTKNILLSGSRPDKEPDIFDRCPESPAPLHSDDANESPNSLKDKTISEKLNERPILSTPYTAPTNEIQKIITRIWQNFFGIRAVGIQDDFFELGGDSLKAMNVSVMMQKELNVEIPIVEFFNRHSIEGLSQYIENHFDKSSDSTIAPVEKKDYYPISSAQQRLYVLQQMTEKNTSYNEPLVVVLEGEFSKQKAENTFQQLIKRHESLRTSFGIINEELVQKIHNEVNFEIDFLILDEIMKQPEAVVLTKESVLSSIVNGFIRHFDLENAPLIRVGLIKEEEELFVLMVDMHHIITDGSSHIIFIHDFIKLYNGVELPKLTIQYKDYAQWQNHLNQSGEIRRQEEYWLREFEGEISKLNLPIDYFRPATLSFEGNRIADVISSRETTILKKMALEKNATLFMVLLSIFNIFLSKLSGQEDIACGTIIAGRRHVEFQKIIGVFVNTLVLRNYPWGESTFEEFLRGIKEKTLEAFENQDYQFENLVDKVEKIRDTGRNPMFDVMFIMQNVDSPKINMPNARVKPYPYQNLTAKFDLKLDCVERIEEIELRFEYSTRLFKEDTLKRFIRYFLRIVSTVTTNPAKKIGDIEIISDEEKEQLLYNFNNTHVAFPGNKSLHQLFEEQVERIPDRIALVGADLRVCPVSLSYHQLNGQSNRLAALLIEKGVLTDNIVGIKIERSLEMIIGIMGILKSGGAYLPIAPGYPQARIDYMLKDSGAKLLAVANDKEGEKVRILEGERVLLEEIFKSTKIPSYLLTFSPSYLLNSSNLAYIIYTSGSTGKPKGVMVEHGAAVNLLYAMQEQYPFAASDTYLLKTSYIFDVSVTEFFGWYMGGGKLAVLEKSGHKDPRVILDWIERYTVTHINFVPSMFNVFIEFVAGENKSRLSSLKYIFLAGEALLPGLAAKFGNLNTDIKLENIYGPTEGTVYSGKYSLSDWNGIEDIPIGKPLPNIKLYILNKYNYLQPIGIVGELCIGGSGLACGYLNRPELTAEKFNRPYGSYKTYILYKTGDLARWLNDGNIEFLGRIDHQVKIRGFRIELGEIESRLMKHMEIKETVVLARSYENGDKYLCAYITACRDFVVSELREHLVDCLPEYMIPSEFLQLEKMPLANGGKIDRQNLNSLGKKLNTGVEHVAPVSDNEVIIADAWKKILKLAEVGINDNFFDLGGTSVDIIRLNGKLKEIFKRDIPIVAMYKYTTIDSFSHFLGDGNEESETNSNGSRSRERTDKIKKGIEDKNKRREIRTRRRK
ncbi:MAG: hypothetical protein QG657_762 [Acidobacteriota bacterium]|nr:hypothetical protein [Acidobacteriota bacterium]